MSQFHHTSDTGWRGIPFSRSSASRCRWPLQIRPVYSCKFTYSTFACFKDGYFGVGVLPQFEELLLCRAPSNDIALQHIGASEAKTGECTNGFMEHHSRMVDYFLKFGGGFFPLMCDQIDFAAHKNRVQAGPIEWAVFLSQPFNFHQNPRTETFQPQGLLGIVRVQA